MDANAEKARELSPLEGYAAWAELYDSDGNPLVALEGPAMAALFGEVTGKDVLDLGCGTGRHTLPLAIAGAHLTAIDQSREMMSRAQTKLAGYPVNWIIHALPAPLPFGPDSFDLVVMGLVAEHIADIRGLMADISRILKPGGRLLLSALHGDRTAEGQTARFIDPQTGRRQPITTYHRTAADYHSAAHSAGLEKIVDQTLIVPPELGRQFPRAARYVGQPLGWIGGWQRPG